MAILDRIPSPPSNSAAYPIRALIPTSPERREVHWHLTGDFPLDQGVEGACTAFGTSAELSALPIAIPTGNTFAFNLYEHIRAEDRAMGYVFPSGATMLAAMRAAKRHGHIQGYRWAQTVDDIRDAVQTHGSVVMGTWWYSGMDSWDDHGLIRVTGERRGGHCWTIVGYHPHHPVHGEVFEGINSWGADWGVRGRFHLTAADLEMLFTDDGEAAIVTDTPQQPAPEPVYAGRYSAAFHRSGHWWVTPHRTFATRAAAVEAGLRPCRICKP